MKKRAEEKASLVGTGQSRSAQPLVLYENNIYHMVLHFNKPLKKALKAYLHAGVRLLPDIPLPPYANGQKITIAAL